MKTDLVPAKAPAPIAERSAVAPTRFPPLPAVSTPVMDEYSQLLEVPPNLPRSEYGLPDLGGVELAPSDKLEAMALEILKTLEPPPRAFISACGAVLANSFPQRPADGFETYARGLVDELERERLPAAAIVEGMRELRRTQKFLPAIAEVIDACNGHVAALRRPLMLIKQQEREHQRRDAEAERERKKRAERAAFAHRLVEHYGHDAPTPDDVDAAWTMLWRWNFGQASSSSLDVLGRWRRALNVGDQWAAEVCRIAAKWAREHLGDDGRVEPPSPKVAKRLIALRDAHCLTAEAA